MHAHTCTPALTLSDERLLSIVAKGMNTKPMTCKTAKEITKITNAQKAASTYIIACLLLMKVADTVAAKTSKSL